MENNKLSMMDAILLETIRNKGISNDEILQKLEEKETHLFDRNTEITSLISLYEEDKTKFASILHNGYTVKFVTRNGLINLLKLKFNKIAERDYQLLENGIKQLQMDEQQLASLKQLLSINWVIQEETNESSLKFIHIISAATI